MADRDERGNQPKWTLKRAVSGSESKDDDRQHPAESRAFPDPSSDPCGKSLHPQPGWRRTESGANWSSGADPCYAGKIQGIPPKSGSYKRIGSEIPQPFRHPTDEFPVIGNREIFLTIRESAGIRSGRRREFRSCRSHPSSFSTLLHPFFDPKHLIRKATQEILQPFRVIGRAISRSQPGIIPIPVAIVVVRKLEKILEVVASLIEKQGRHHSGRSSVAVQEGMDVDESMLEDAGLDDWMNPRVASALALRLAGFEPFQQRFEFAFEDVP